MLQNRYVIGGGIIFVLIVANIISYIFSGWGLITIHVNNAPIAQVVKSIERQGWVTIYSDLDPGSTVTMDVIRVPLPEAMATLCANITRPDNGEAHPPGGVAADGGAGRPPGGGAPGGGGPGEGGGRRNGGGFGGGAQWKLGFFAAPTSAQVKDEIRNFQSSNLGDEAKIFSYPTPLDMLAGDSDMPSVADPRLQAWPGYKAPPPPVAPVADNSGDGSPAPPADPPAPPSTVQDYLNALAQESDIWIVAPASWEAHVAAAPSPSASIIRAVKSLVGSAHGSVQEAIILTSRRGGGGGQRGGGFGGGDTGWAYTEDRIRNAIGGLPPEDRPAALNQLTAEVKFMHDVQAAPADQRRDMMRKHFMNRMGNNDFRRSPEKRAQRYARAVSNRQTATGH
jgi:hypothetical protein